MQAILVRYHGPSSTRGAYYTAHAQAGKIRVVAHLVPPNEGPRYVAKLFVKKVFFDAPDVDLLRGVLPNGDSVFVFDHLHSREG